MPPLDRAVWLRRGWLHAPLDPDILKWVDHARSHARIAVADPDLAEYHVCEGTWFVGLDALPNDANGQLSGGPPLDGDIIRFLRDLSGPLPPLHRAQVSVTYPGYPRPRAGEGDAAFTYRLKRDAAHVDGLLPVGPERRRMVQEPHAFILGLPLTTASAGAAPLVIWEGSHHILGAAFRRALGDCPPEKQSTTDVTKVYQDARRLVFDTCPRRTLPAKPGEAILLHRHLLHGVAPWDADATAGPDGRMIAYFRPEASGGVPAWLVED